MEVCTLGITSNDGVVLPLLQAAKWRLSTAIEKQLVVAKGAGLGNGNLFLKWGSLWFGMSFECKVERKVLCGL